MNIIQIFHVPSSSVRLSAMEGLRAYAAGIVFLLHLASSFASNRLNIRFDDVSVFQLIDTQPAYLPLYWLWSSHYGVDIFFLLSGYLIAGMVNKENFHYPRFILHRFLRIYPTLIISTFAYILYITLVKGGTLSFSLITANFLLLNGIPVYGFPDINLATWSLFFEFSFYFFFPILWSLCKRDLGRLAFISFILIVPFLLISPSYMRFMMFIGGVILQVISESKLIKIRQYLTEWQVIFIYVLSTSVFMFTKNFVLYIPLYIFTAMLLVDRALNYAGWLSKALSFSPLRYFGNISFSFYLFHLLGLRITRQILATLNIQNDYVYFAWYFIISFTISIIVSIICFTFVEKSYFKNKDKFDTVFDRLIRMK